MAVSQLSTINMHRVELMSGHNLTWTPADRHALAVMLTNMTNLAQKKVFYTKIGKNTFLLGKPRRHFS